MTSRDEALRALEKKFQDEATHAHTSEARDAARLDWLERMANVRGGLLLHDGSESGRTGLGLRPGALSRTIREAIDAAMRQEAGDD